MDQEEAEEKAAKALKIAVEEAEAKLRTEYQDKLHDSESRVRRNVSIQAAQKGIANGLSDEMIADVTGLSVEEVRGIRESR